MVMSSGMATSSALSSALPGVFPFNNTYARLPDSFYARLNPTAMPKPQMVRLNTELADELGLDVAALASEDGIRILAGSALPDGAEPLAMAYSGHQFGHWSGQLGDGRAILLGEVIDHNGQRRDIHLKGCGRTPFSRGGDGRAVLGPVMREYIVSEGMAALSIPTSRALAAVTTGETVMREGPLPGAVLTRVAASHLRVGTFQHFAAQGNVEALKTLLDYAIERHVPAAREADIPAIAFLEHVMQAQARLIADWMGVGFIHGVMNTDNMTISGETIDFGPCAFMDDFHPGMVFSSIDQQGRYAYGNQPHIGHWNLVRLAETLLPLINPDSNAAIKQVEPLLMAFPEMYETAWRKVMGRKLGLSDPTSADKELMDDLLAVMTDGRDEQGADFTLTFRDLCRSDDPAENLKTTRKRFADANGFDRWSVQWQHRLGQETASFADIFAAMRQVNPTVIPRNHLVEAAIRAAEDHGDLGPFDDLLTALKDPFAERPADDHFARPPAPEEVVAQTFCGT